MNIQNYQLFWCSPGQGLWPMPTAVGKPWDAWLAGKSHHSTKVSSWQNHWQMADFPLQIGVKFRIQLSFNHDLTMILGSQQMTWWIPSMISAQSRFRLQDETHGTSCLRQSAQCLRSLCCERNCQWGSSITGYHWMICHSISWTQDLLHIIQIEWGTFGQKNQGKRIVRVYKIYKHKDANTKYGPKSFDQ